MSSTRMQSSDPLLTRSDQEALASLVAEAVVKQLHGELRSQLDRLEAQLDALANAKSFMPRKAKLPYSHSAASSSWLSLEEASTTNSGHVPGGGSGGAEMVTPGVASGARAGSAEEGVSESDPYSMIGCRTSEPPRGGLLGKVDWLGNLVGSKQFKYLSLMGVLVYIAMIIFLINQHSSIKWGASPVHAEPLDHWVAVVLPLLTAQVTLEVFLQLLVYGKDVALHDSWFYVDVAGMIGMWVDIASLFGLLGWYIVTILPRVLRGLKVFRILAFSSELNFIMTCVGRSAQTFLWAALLLCFSLLVVALLFQQWVLNFNYSFPDSPHNAELIQAFPSVEGMMLVLLQAITGGIDWGELYDKLALMGSLPALCLVCFIVFIQLNAFNVATSIFVNKSMEVAEEKAEEKEKVARRMSQPVNPSQSSFASLARN